METTKTTFADIGLGDKLLNALNAIGYQHPTPIQEQAIPVVLMGRDVIGVAQTGTGKTASFTLPLLEILGTGKAKSRMPRALILAPTRELAAQIQDNIKQYSQNTNITSALLVGGEAMGEQTAALQRGVDILIATPGRLMDHFQRGGLILTDTKFFIIDEADRMLDMGFIPDIEKIAGFLPKLRQTLMFTATMPPEIKRLAEKFLSNPKEITVARASSTALTISQHLHATTKTRKEKDLLDILYDLNPSSVLIFCNRKTDVDKVKRMLTKAGHQAEGMHGDMEQRQRYASLDRFKSGESKIIVCSDIAARGIDIDDVSHVINFDVPRHPEDYVHRIGRTGRAGKTGMAITFTIDEEQKNVDAILKLTQQESIPPLPGFNKKPQPVATAPVERKDKPVNNRPEKSEKPERTARPERSERPARSAGKPVREKYETLEKDGTIGFGDDVPAFMRNGS